MAIDGSIIAEMQVAGSKNAIVLMAAGGRHLQLYRQMRKQFLAYSNVCTADLYVHIAPPDSSMLRDLATQKMLLPHFHRQYDWAALIDIDIIISKKPQSIFDFVVNDKGYGAVVTPRDSGRFKNLVVHRLKLPEILEETHSSYLCDRGFEPHPADAEHVASINGGLHLCRPSLVSDLFRQKYYSGFREHAREGGASSTGRRMHTRRRIWRIQRKHRICFLQLTSGSI